MQGGAHGIRLGPGEILQGLQQRSGKPRLIGPAGKDQLHPGVGQNIAVVGIQRLRRNGLHRLPIPVLADPIGLMGEHLLPEPCGGIGPLIVDLGHNGID